MKKLSLLSLPVMTAAFWGGRETLVEADTVVGRQMRKVIVLLVSILTALAVGLGPVWPTPAEKADLGPVVAAAATEPTPEAFPKNLTGEVVSVEKGGGR